LIGSILLAINPFAGHGLPKRAAPGHKQNFAEVGYMAVK
jgi:hypothetical protein